MKDFVSRSMQISCLSHDQIRTLHEVELKNRFILPNWNIQEMFNLPTIKDRYSIPERQEALTLHAERIEREIRDRGLLKVEITPDERNQMIPENILWNHSFDWNICNAVGTIVWDYAGGKGGSLKSQLE